MNKKYKKGDDPIVDAYDAVFGNETFGAVVGAMAVISLTILCIILPLIALMVVW